MDNAVIQAATQESDIQSDDFYKVDEILSISIDVE